MALSSVASSSRDAEAWKETVAEEGAEPSWGHTVNATWVQLGCWGDIWAVVKTMVNFGVP